MKKLLLLLIPISILIGCKSNQETTNNTSSEVVIEFKKTPCYGKCPVYNASIKSDGSMTYFGKTFVDNLGDFEGQISKEQIEEIYDLAERIGFFELNDNYDDKGITDVPSATTTINYNGKSKTVYNRHNGPAKLRDLENLIHSTIHEVEMKKVQE